MSKLKIKVGSHIKFVKDNIKYEGTVIEIKDKEWIDTKTADGYSSTRITNIYEADGIQTNCSFEE